MKKLVLFLHITLDGFTARTNGSMDWVTVSEELFEISGQRTQEADVALYGRNTFAMMDSYWPTAGDEPGASKHDVEHSAWYKAVNKVVVSATQPDQDGITFIRDDVYTQISELKQGGGKDIVMFGSPALGSSLLNAGLVNELWLFVNPVIIGSGYSFSQAVDKEVKLELIDSQTFPGGVTCLHYRTV